MTREEARIKAENLVDQMTVEEMASQLRFDAPAIERLGIPEYNWWGEALHGVARAGAGTVFPQAIAYGATFDPEMVQTIGDMVSTEARAKYNMYSAEGDRDIYKGLTLWSPNVNIFRDPRWGRGHETYGEDPFLTSRLGVSYVKGLQGDGDNLKIAACAKHFAVHSGPEADRHYFDAKATKKDMWETYLPAFEACVKEAEVESVMGAYNRTNGEPCCAHTELMEEILRGKWEFAGHFVSDCWAIKDFHENHMVTNNSRESAALAITKGCDVNCGSTYLCLLQAYKEKKVTKQQIRTSAVRLFTTRYLLGDMEGSEYDSIPYNVIECKKHLDYAKEVALKSMVLLKNDDMLPLKKSEINTIAVIGPNANSRAALIGNYHGTASRYWTVTEGIQEEVKDDDIRVYVSEGSHLFKDRVEHLGKPDDRIAEAKGIARLADVVILAVGLDETLEGEEGDTGNSYASGDKTTLSLPQSQQNLVNALIEVGKPIVLLNMTGSAMDLTYAKDSSVIKAIIQTWYPGAEGGKAIADILFGKVSPSGKLPVTFYNSLEELPDFKDYSMKNRTYRYMENKAQYPFGFGLTYSKVSVKSAAFASEADIKEAMKDAAVLDNSWFDIKAVVVNEGDCDTDEVIQVYSRVDSEFAVKNHSLCGMQRVSLAAGEKKEITVRVSGKGMLVVNDEGERIVDGNNYTFYVGISQPDEVSVELTGTRPIELAMTR